MNAPVNAPVNWTNPYANRKGTWLRGSLHTHTSPASHCGRVSLERTLELYDDKGYDFLSISDHMTLTSASHDRMVLIPGIEWNGPGSVGHTNIISCDGGLLAPHTKTESQIELLESLARPDVLCILNHPDWRWRPHYRREELEALSGYDGIEIFNGGTQFETGSPLSTDKWDYLLAKGKRVLGFASDDFHVDRHLAHGWIVARAEARTPESIFEALKSGNFYSSTGVELTDVRREGDVITVESADGEEIHVLSDHGLLEKVPGHSVSVDIRQWNVSYVRFAIFGHGSRMAWTQPFFREA